MKKLATGFLLVAVGAFAAAWVLRERDSDPQFDWFRYQGNDPVYEQTARRADQYLNPILPGFYPDPSIVRAGSDYYLVNSSFSYFPGVPIFHSKDLVNWRQIGHVLSRPSQLNLDSLGISQGIYAPALRYHNGTFYLITTLIGRGGNFLVTARDARGPWSDPVFFEFEGIDPSIFFDDDGRAYIVNNGPPEGAPLYDGHRAIWLQEFDPAARKLIGPRSVIVNGGSDITKQPIWIEGPHIFRNNGWYYLIAAEGGTGENHSEVVFRSRDVRGPYVPYAGNPILTQRHLPADRPFPVAAAGHADFVQTQNGEWWAVFLGVRPYAADFFNTGRETFLLPVQWQDGWPVVLRGSEAVPYAVRKPNLPAQPAGNVQSGNFSEHDGFDGSHLQPYWVFIRTPREQWYDLAANPGWLTLRARSAEITSRAQPSFLGRRQQHMYASASTALRYSPGAEGEKAGLMVFQNDFYFYCLCVTRVNGRNVLQLERSVSSAGPALFSGTVQPGARAVQDVLASLPLPSARRATIYLRITARADRYDFAYGFQPDQWTVMLNDVDGKILSSMGAGGFVGAMFGLYAYRPEPKQP